MQLNRYSSDNHSMVKSGIIERLTNLELQLHDLILRIEVNQQFLHHNLNQTPIHSPLQDTQHLPPIEMDTIAQSKSEQQGSLPVNPQQLNSSGTPSQQGTSSSESEPGVPYEEYKTEEKSLSVYIPPGTNGIIRM